MDERLLLEAIGKMMDNKIGALREEITGLIADGQKEMSGHIENLREEMTRQNNETRVLVENGYKRIENLLRENYSRIADAAARGAAAAESHKELQSTVSDHDHALQNHNQRITELERKAI